MEGFQVMTIGQLLEKYGSEAKCYIMDIQQSLTLIDTLEKKIDNLTNTIQRNNLCISIGQNQEMSEYQGTSGYQEMTASGISDIIEEENSPVVVNSCDKFSVESTGEERKIYSSRRYTEL